MLVCRKHLWRFAAPLALGGVVFPLSAALFNPAEHNTIEPPPSAAAVQGAELDAREQLRQQQRERVLREQNAPDSDVRLARPSVVLPDYPINEQPCFIINTLRLEGDSAARFQWALDAANGARGRCLGSQGIVLIINKVQNAILARGYVTTRVMAQEQDLTTGVLTLTLQPGRIGDIRFEAPVSWRGRLWNAIPASPGDILNLRDLEQGLENFKRVPSAAADINIVPGEREATSDLRVNWKAGRPVRLNLGLDDSGAKSTGRYLGSATLAVDAPLAQNDLFYANIGKNLFQHGPFGNRSHTLNYFFPIGYWAVSANYNDYTYQQNIPNANEVLSYSGKSDNLQLTVSRLLFRNQAHKTTLNLRAYRKHSSNAVDGIDIGLQQRRTAGWELGVNQRSYLGRATLDANLNWRRGTGAFGALPAPEETTHSGSARTGILLGDLSVNQPFVWGKQPWRYYTLVRGQWSPNALTPQERMAIAGRYTVRGFDGEQMLSGEKGLLWRNELAWNVGARGHELYLAADGAAPELAIDMGQMGGMYSGHIRMIGTEAGVGVRNQGGHLQAEKTLVVSSEGKLAWQAGTAEPYTQAGGDISLTARDSVEHQGKLYSGGQLAVQSRQGEIRQSGTLAAAGNVTLRAEQGIQSSGALLAGSDANSSLIRPADITLVSQGDIRASGSLLSQKQVAVTGRRVDLSHSRLVAEQAQLTAQAGDVVLQQAQVDSEQLTVNSLGHLDTQQAQIRAGNWQITVDSLYNQAGVWSQVGMGESRFTLSGALDNTDGSIEAQRLSLNSAALNNLHGRLVALDGTAQHWRVSGLLNNTSGVMGGNGGLQLDVGALVNLQGTLQSQSTLGITALNGLDNRQGRLLAGGSLALNSQGLLSNQEGEIRGQHLQLAAQALNNTGGQMVSQGRLQLDAQEAIDNQQGLMEAGDVLAVTTEGHWDNRKGTALGGQQASIAAGSLDNAAGRLQSGGELAINTAGNINNQAGTLTAQQDLHWQGGALSLFNNDAGKLLSGSAMSLNGGQLNNRQQGLVQSQQALALHLSGAWDNQGGKLASGGSGTIRACELINTQGVIQALDTLDMQFTGALDNRNGTIFSQQAQRLLAENILNAEGWIGSQGSLTAVSQRFDNQQGEVVSQQDASLTATRWNNQYGVVQSAGSVLLQILQDVYNQGGKISAQARLWLQGQTDAALAGVLHNEGGQLLAGEQLQIRAQSIDNPQNGLLYSQQQLHLTLSDQLDNRQGNVQSGEGVQISAARLLNAQGVISSQGTIQLTADQFDNLAGTVIGQGAGDYHFSYLNNQQGKIHSGGALTLNGSRMDNQAGQLVSSQALTLNGENIDNSHQGIISSQGALTVYAGQLNNRDGGLLIGTTQTDVSAQTLDNSAGRVQSAGTLALSQLAALDNRQGRILSNDSLRISGGAMPALALLNQGGTIQSGGALTVAAQSLDNQGGTLLSQQALQLSIQQDYTHRAGDTINSNSAVTLRVAGVLTNLADWLLPGELTLYSTHLNNLATLVGKTLRFTTGELRNQGRIEADTLALDADSLDNSATLMADNLTVNSRTVDNHGREALIAATAHISLITGERLTNQAGALIYSAGSLALSSADLIENRAGTIEAEGDLTLTATRFDNLRDGLEIERDAQTRDYSWHRYNYYWRSYGEDVNTDVSTLAPTTQRLTFRDDAAAESNPYGTLLNIDANAKRAEVQVKDAQGQSISLWVNYLALVPNADGSYAMTFYETRGPRQRAVPTPYQNTVWWNATDSEKIEQWSPDRFIDIASAPYVTDYNNLRERTVTGTLTEDRLVSAGVGASLLAWGNMFLHIAGQLQNDASTISSNGNLTIDGTANIINRGYSVNQRRQEYIVDHYDRAEGHWYPTYTIDETTALTTLDGVISGYGNVTLGGAQLTNTTVNQAQISTVAAAQNAAAAERAEWERNPLAVNISGQHWQAADTGLAEGSRPLTPGELALTDQQHLANVATTIPNNGLFRQQTAAESAFLVVTDSRFTDRSQFLSSDYLLQQVGYDPSQVHKRLGDGYYEQRVVREQLLALTGRPSLQGFDAMAQYQALMNNAITVAEDFHLVPGVALTPSQIAALQQDIVWLVSETVETATGPQTVWVPQVYLANSTVRITGDGAVIAGGNLQLSTGSLSNAANLFADQALSIDSDQFLHLGGDIRADILNVQADRIGLSTNLQDALRQASMQARELSLSGGDIRLQGASLTASENLSLSASNNLNITTARSSTTAELNVIAGAMGNRTSAGLEAAGERLAQVSGEWQQALGSSLNAGGNLSLTAGQDLTLQGSQAAAGGEAQLRAGGNVALLADTTTHETQLHANSSTSTVSNRRREETLHTSALSGDNGVTLVAGGAVIAEGAQVDSAAGSIGLSAQQVTLKEARQRLAESDSEQNQVGDTQSQRQTESASDTALGSVFSAKDGVTVVAKQGDITLQGSTLQSEAGTIGLSAAGDISLNASRDEQHLMQQGSSSSKGFLSSSQNAYQREEHSSTANGSLLSGQAVILQSGKDINVMGSNIVASEDIALTAGNDITLGTVENHYQASAASQSKKSGFSGTGGIGFSYGTNSLKITDSENIVSQVGSTVGSIQGNVTLNAGNHVTVQGSDVLAAKDINLAGKDVDILAAENQSRQTHSLEQKQSGLTLALSGSVGSAANTAVTTANQAGKESSGRLATLQGMKAALSGVEAAQGGVLATTDAQNQNAIGVSLSYGSQSFKSEQASSQTQSQGSTLTAGNSLNIHATGSDINVQGSQLQAGKDITLNAARDVNLVSAENSQQLEGKNESKGGSIGVGIGAGQGGWGISVSASVNKGTGSESGNGLTHTETTLNAGNNLTITSGRDTTLTGAQVSGDKVTMDVGRNLTLTSEQDSDNYDAKQQNASAGGSFTFGSMSGSGSVNLSRDKMHSNYDSVQEQTGIFAGQGGVDITVGEHTQLNGAVIGSTASTDKNTLDTGTLGFSDIENKADYQVEHQSVGISSGGSIGGQFAGNMANGLLTGVNGSGSARSTTQSAVSEGTIIIRDPANQQQDVADLSRDVEHANQTLSPIFDKEKEQNRLREAQLIGEIGNQVSDIVRTQGQIEATKAANERMQSVTPEQLKSAEAEWRKTNPGKEPTADDISGQVYQNFYNQAFNASGYGTGGKYQQVIQAATAAVQGLAGGDLAKALAGGSAPYLATIIAQTTEEGTSRLMAHAVVNAVLAAAQGNNALAGAAGAVSGEVMAQLVMEALYPGKNVSELSESEKQTISMLGTLAAGLAGGLIGDSNADTLTAAQAGKTSVENNFLGATSSDKLDKAVEKIKNGDKSLATANELIKLENADKRSDALVSKFTKDPSQMSSAEQAELAGYLRVYASEMEREYGSAVSQELIKGLLSGQDYMKRNPDSEAMSKAQTIMNTWGYHKSNASIGDTPLMFGGNVLGTTIKEGMALNAAIGVGVNTVSQLSGKEPFSYVDAIMAGITSAATTGKGIGSSAAINMAGAAVGSGIKGENPTNSVIGAGLGSVAGSKAEKYVTGGLSTAVKEGTAEVIGAVGGSTASMIVSDAAKNALDKAEHKDEKK